MCKIRISILDKQLKTWASNDVDRESSYETLAPSVPEKCSLAYKGTLLKLFFECFLCFPSAILSAVQDKPHCFFRAVHFLHLLSEGHGDRLSKQKIERQWHCLCCSLQCSLFCSGWPLWAFQLLEYQWGEGRFDTLGLLGSAHRALGQQAS